MKIALVHDWLVTIGGAERVLGCILDIYPDADIYTIIDTLDNSERKLIHGKKCTTTFIQNLPRARTKYRNYLPLMPIAIEQLNLSKYDLVISSSHAVAKGVITGPDQLHICYCHSPIRYAWDMQFQYLEESNLSRGIKSIIARIFLYKIRGWDYRTANGVDHFISNSNYISRRIKKIYGRESTTIYPNVAVDSFKETSAKEDFYLTASRMVPYKKIDLIVKAFAKTPNRKLVVIGDGPQIEKVKKFATPNIRILGHQPFEVLRDHMQRAKAFIFAAEEDFGIAVVEAQACGTPVIAYAKGGALETVIEGKTGIFFHSQREESINDAVDKFERNSAFNSIDIRQHAEQFSTERFKAQFMSFVSNAIQKRTE
ncbi:glycosyl transferase family 1 [Pseudomonas sp. AU11447]|uniref:glycosyltransferase family 4 protein n=1 Tax=unclassified Pseudomonas TaxID=196821 RepID=UPI0006D47222|nr:MULTISPECIES: glycosyltransferase family 4 protein [unclassified Pseudomonas]OBY92284.1 glycosyl transferase family 1 [Pseudomonas sp. AU11447]